MTEKPESILIVENRPIRAGFAENLLRSRFEASVHLALDGASARSSLAALPHDVVLISEALPDADGASLVREFSSISPDSTLILITENANDETACSALLDGAMSCINRAQDFEQSLLETTERALDRTRKKKTASSLEFEHRKLLAVLDGINQAVYISDPETHELLYLNNLLRSIYGDAVGRKCYRVLQDRSTPCSFCTNHIIFNPSGTGSHIWEHFNTRNRRWYRCIDTAINWPDGRRVRCEMSVDVTDLKLAEEQSLIQAGALEATEQAVFGVSLAGTVTHINRNAEELLGLPSGEMVGKSVIELLPSLKGKSIPPDPLEIFRKGEPWSGELKVERPDGNMSHVMLALTPVFDGEDTTRQMVGILTDISRRIRADEALRALVMESNARRAEVSALLEGTRYILEHRELEDAISTVLNICRKLIWAGTGIILSAGQDSEGGMALIVHSDGNTVVQHPPSSDPVCAHRSEVLSSNEPVIENTVPASRWASGLLNQFSPVENMLSAPVTAESIPLGMICFLNKPGGFSRRDALMASAFGEIITLAVRNSLTMELLERSEERFRSIAETANDAVFCADASGSIIFWNQSARRMFGYQAGEIIGMKWRKVIPPRFHGVFSLFDNLPHYTRPGKTFELYGLRRDGSEFPVILSPSVWSAGNEWFLTLMIQDITERKQAEDMLEKVNAELELYAHTVSHDLRGPLTNITVASSSLNELMNRELDQKTRKNIEAVVRVIAESSERASKLVSDLLKLAEAAQQPRELTPIDIRKVVNEVLSDLSSDIARKQVEVVITGDLGQVTGNPTQFYQLFSNLIRNAIKHNDSSTPVVEIIGLGVDHEGARRYLIRENGSGIAPEFIDRIFDPFFSLSPGGVGLGLAITAKVVEVYGGSIHAYNDNGACIEFSLKDATSSMHQLPG